MSKEIFDCVAAYFGGPEEDWWKGSGKIAGHTLTSTKDGVTIMRPDGGIGVLVKSSFKALDIAEAIEFILEGGAVSAYQVRR